MTQDEDPLLTLAREMHSVWGSGGSYDLKKGEIVVAKWVLCSDAQREQLRRYLSNLIAAKGPMKW